MCSRLVVIVGVTLLLLLNGAVASADDPFRVVLSRVDAADFPTVRLVASVVDLKGKAVAGLRPQDLQVRESGVASQANVSLASMVSPVALALVLDTSGSMSGRPLADAKTAMATMISALGANDQVAILSFNATVRIAQPLTADKARALAAVGSLVAGGDTAIYDAVLGTVDALKGADPRARRAIVLLTDGFDTASRSSRESAIARLAGSGFPMYTIGLGSSIDRQTIEALAAAAPGGAAYVAPTSSQLAGIYNALSEQILTEYSVEYRSAATGLADGSAVAFEIVVSREGVIIARTTSSFLIPAGRGMTKAAAPTAAPQTVATPAPVMIDTRRPQSWIVGLLGAMTALMFVLWLNELTLHVGAAARRRLRALSADAGIESESAGGRPLLARVSGPLRSIGRAVLRFLPQKYIDQTRHRLELAGEPMNEAEFVGLLCVGTICLSALLALIVMIVSVSVSSSLIGAAVGAAAGFALPGLVISSKARARRKAIRRALIPSLDMLALSAEAGLAFDGAIAQVVQRWKNPLSDELRRLLLEFQMGRERRQALRELARRTDVPDISKFVNAVIQADTLGVGLAKVLQDQAVELRTKRRQRAEEQARLAPVKMMFPMVLLIFPALFLVILGPAVPKLTSIFNIVN